RAGAWPGVAWGGQGHGDGTSGRLGGAAGAEAREGGGARPGAPAKAADAPGPAPGGGGGGVLLPAPGRPSFLACRLRRSPTVRARTGGARRPALDVRARPAGGVSRGGAGEHALARAGRRADRGGERGPGGAGDAEPDGSDG